MSEVTARSATLDVLADRDVTHIFGNPGTTELPLVSALPTSIDYVLCLQESVAVGAAAGYSLLGDRPAVVNLHAMPGLGHAMASLRGASLMNAPVVVIVGQQSSTHLHREPLLSGDIASFARPAVKWAHEVSRPQHLAHAVERAIRVALSPPQGPALVAVPMDYWEQVADPVETSSPSEPPRPDPHKIEELGQALISSERGALALGDRINSPAAWAAAIAIADAWDLTVYSAPIGTQPGFPTRHPRYRGTLPLTTSALHRAVNAHDSIATLGAPMFTMYLDDHGPLMPPTSQTWIVTDDPDEAARAETSSVILGDPEAALLQLAKDLPHDPTGWRGRESPGSSSDGLGVESAVRLLADRIDSSLAHR